MLMKAPIMGQNSGGKVTPQCSIPKAVSALTRQGERSCQQSQNKVCNEVRGSKTWSSSTYSDKILVKSESMFKAEREERKNYNSIKVKIDQWLVIHHAERKPSLIPQFF